MVSASGGRWLGVDLGQARVGLALSDPDGILAMPLRTLERSGRSLPALAEELARQASEVEAARMVVGLPLNMDGSESPNAAEARKLAEILETNGWMVLLQDERRSSVQAHAQLREAGRRTKRHRPVVDQVAAVIILQTALDTRS